MTTRPARRAIPLVVASIVAFNGCEGDQREMMGPALQFAKPCSTDPTHPSCPGGDGGNERSGTLDAAGGLVASDLPVVIESDLSTKIKVFTEDELAVEYNLTTTRDRILADACPILHGRNVSGAQAKAIAHALAAELDDSQLTTRVVAAADWTDGEGVLFTGYTSGLGPVRIRITDASDFSENGAPTVTRTFDDGVTTTWRYEGGTLLVWLTVKKQDAVKIGCPNEEVVDVTLHR